MICITVKIKVEIFRIISLAFLLVLVVTEATKRKFYKFSTVVSVQIVK